MITRDSTYIIIDIRVILEAERWIVITYGWQHFLIIWHFRELPFKTWFSFTPMIRILQLLIQYKPTYHQCNPKKVSKQNLRKVSVLMVENQGNLINFSYFDNGIFTPSKVKLLKIAIFCQNFDIYSSRFVGNCNFFERKKVWNWQSYAYFY